METIKMIFTISGVILLESFFLYIMLSIVFSKEKNEKKVNKFPLCIYMRDEDSIEHLKCRLDAEKEKSDFYQKRYEQLTATIQFKQEANRITVDFPTFEEIQEKMKKQGGFNVPEKDKIEASFDIVNAIIPRESKKQWKDKDEIQKIYKEFILILERIENESVEVEKKKSTHRYFRNIIAIYRKDFGEKLISL